MITPPRIRHRVRAFAAATLAVIVVSLVASAPTASANSIPDKKCISISEDYDLRNAARNSDVFVIVHEKDDKDARQHICDKLENTPDERVNDAHEKSKGAVFAYMELTDGFEDSDGYWQDGNRGLAKASLGLKSFPAFLFVSKGMDGKSKYANHVTSYKGSADSLDLSDVENFIEKKVGFKLGNDVYNIIFFDSIASRFVSYGDATGQDYYKQRLLALLVRLSTIFSYKEPFSTIGKLYNRAFSMSFEHGMDYTEKQVRKLQEKLDKNSKNLSKDKIHEFQQKIAVLKAFADPKELTAEDDKQIFIHAALHFGLLLATILLLVVPAGEDSEDKEKEVKDGEDVINAKPVVAKAVNGKDEDEQSTKKTK